MQRTGSHFKVLRWVLLIILIGFAIMCYVGYSYYQKMVSPAVHANENTGNYLLIPKGASLESVADSLYAKGFIDGKDDFLWLADKKNYHKHIYSGKYLVADNMSLNELINLLRSGQEVMVNLTFNNIRTKEELAGKVAQYISTNSIELLNKLNSPTYITKYGFNEYTILTMFIPNTYEFHWYATADDFIDRMAKEYKRFWTDERKAKARKMGMSQSEVATLASIVQKESSKKDESSRIAGVYINRLKKNMLLQADPTVVYAVGDFSIRRVLNKHKRVNSPYNTYKNKGLPPGPICLPEIHYMDAVLNYEDHRYIFFCAREDFSGYHNFAITYREHNLNARRYRAALNKRKIYN